MAEDERPRPPRSGTAVTVRKLLDGALQAAGQTPSRAVSGGKGVRQRVMENCSRWGADYRWVIKHFRTELGRIGDELGVTTAAILAREPQVGWSRIEEALHVFGDWKAYTDTPLTITERMLRNSRDLEAEYSNGGTWQYFHNASGDDWQLMLRLLGESGDSAGEEQFRELLDIFRDGEPSADCELRRRELEAIEAAIGKEMWDHFEHYTDLWHTHPYPRPDLVATLVKARQNDIVPIWLDEADFE